MDPKFTFVCRTRAGEMSYNCPDVTYRVIQAGFYHLKPQTCQIVRQWSSTQPRFQQLYREQMLTFAPTPLIYHGNGFAKKMFMRGLGRDSFECMLRQRLNLTAKEYYK